MRDVLCSSLSFCVYQFSQMVLMGKLSAVPFSVIITIVIISIIISSSCSSSISSIIIIIIIRSSPR